MQRSSADPAEDAAERQRRYNHWTDEEANDVAELLRAFGAQLVLPAAFSGARHSLPSRLEWLVRLLSVVVGSRY